MFDHDDVFMTCNDSPVWHLDANEWNNVTSVNNISMAWKLYFEDKYDTQYDADEGEYIYYV